MDEETLAVRQLLVGIIQRAVKDTKLSADKLCDVCGNDTTVAQCAGDWLRGDGMSVLCEQLGLSKDYILRTMEHG